MKDEKIEKILNDLARETMPEDVQKIAEDISRKFKNNLTTTKPNLWEHIMKTKITKLAIAAVIVIAILIGINQFDGSIDWATPAYAIEQTIEAGQNVRYFRFEYFGSSDDIPAKETWLEYDENGQIENVRVNWYEMGGKKDDMVMVWKEGKTQMWLKKDKRLQLFEDESYTAKVLFFAQRYNPTRAIEHIYELQEKGDVEIEIEEPMNRTDPIVITATYLPNTFLLEKTMPQMREIFFVDQSNKLVTTIEIYELMEGEYIDRGVWRYPDYDKLFEAGVFNLEEEVPSDVRRLDLMKFDVGLEQENLTKEEIALKVTRKFFEAWRAKDYDEAVKIHGYSDPDRKADLQKRFEEFNIIRIISIGEPFSSPPGSENSLGVPCTIEVEQEERIFEWQLDLFVGRAMGQPRRWSIRKIKYP